MSAGYRQVALFPEDRDIPEGIDLGIQVKLKELQLLRPRQWGACWLGCNLTSTYFESDPPFEGKRQFGYSRDKRSDCVQVVIALVVTPDGFPLGYEVMAGNTADHTTLRGFLKKIEKQHGKAERVWIMDRGIPTEEVLAEMRVASTPVYYLVGTPQGRLSRYEEALTAQPWEMVRDDVSVKLLQDGDEVYVYAQSHDRIKKERSMRKRRLKLLINKLNALRNQKRLTRDALLMKLGAARKDAGRAFNLLDIALPDPEQPINEQTFYWRINRTRYISSLPSWPTACMSPSGSGVNNMQLA